MAVIVKRLGFIETGTTGGNDAINIEYNNTTSGLTAVNVQDAIDELAVNIDGYSESFVIADWVLNGSNYTLTIADSTHNITNPVVQTYALDTGILSVVDTQVDINGTNDITISVNQTPDLRFDGLIVIK